MGHVSIKDFKANLDAHLNDAARTPMKLIWSEDSWAECLHWQEHDPRMVECIDEPLRDAKRHLADRIDRLCYEI